MAEPKQSRIIEKKIDADLVGKYFDEYVNEPTRPETPMLVAAALEQYLVGVTKKASLILCDCLGYSPEDFKECPYCGDKDIVPAEEAMLKPKGNGKATKPVKISKPRKSPSKDSIGEAALDECIDVIKSGSERMVSSLYDIAQALQKIKDDELWKHRAGVEHQNFRRFCDEELPYTSVYVNRLILTSTNYTREQFEKIGAGKLSIILKAPEGARDGLLDDAESGASRTQLSQKARELVDGKPSPKVPNSAMTISVVKPMVELQMYTRPKNPEAAGLITEKAKSIAQSPWASEKLVDGKVIYYRVVKESDGTWKLIREIRTGKDALDQ